LLESEIIRSIFASCPNAIVISDLNGKIVECNRLALDMAGYSSKDELIGKNGLTFVAAKDHERARLNLMKTLKQGVLKNVEYTILTKDGHEIQAEVSLGVIKDPSDNPTFLVAIIRDITERRQMEQQLKDAERLATIGEVAATVGHDLRNPLQGIAGATYYLKMKLGSKVDNESRRMLEIIEEDIEYSDKIINDLLEYSRELRLELADTSARSLVKGALSVVKVPTNVRIVDSTKSKPRVRADAGKMKRVFVNLIKNAVEAMPKGGMLKIASKKSNGNLEITFSDTGIGMPKQVMEKIWSPSFTTKSKGIGFGLSICKRIVEAHGGSISAESTGERGSTFTVKLPIEPTMKEVQEK